jgi:ribosomal-protein-serine acetyltransferase
MFSLKVDDDISLALFEDRHSERLYSLVESNRAYLREWMGWLDSNASPDDTLKYIRTVREKFASNTNLQTAIWYKGEMAGGIGLNNLVWSQRYTDIGYWLAQQYTGKGIMIRACRALVDYAFTELSLNRVIIRAAVGNTKSRAIPERLGFVLEGTLRDGEWLYDHFVDLAQYSMLAREWPARPHGNAQTVNSGTGA